MSSHDWLLVLSSIFFGFSIGWSARQSYEARRRHRALRAEMDAILKQQCDAFDAEREEVLKRIQAGGRRTSGKII